MNAYQARIYRDNIRNGIRFGIAGSSWTLYRPDASDTITARTTYTSQGSTTLYIVEEKLSAYGQPQPPQPVGVTPYRLIAPIDTDVRVHDIAVSGAFAFEIKTLDSDQGFPSGKCEKTTSPAAVASSGAGYRSPLWILGVSA